MKNISLFFILVGVVLTGVPEAKANTEESRAAISACIDASGSPKIRDDGRTITTRYDCYGSVARLIKALNRQAAEDSQGWGYGGGKFRELECEPEKDHCWVIVSRSL